MMTRMSSAITQFTFVGSALAGYPLAVSAARTWFGLVAGSQPRISVLPILVTTGWPGAPGIALKFNPALVMNDRARSQAVCLVYGPTKMWKLHSAGSAVTEIGTVSWNFSSAGLT